MKLLLRPRWLLALLLSLGSLPAAQATHLHGIDISYTPVASTTAGVPRYHILVRQFITPGTTWIINNVYVTASQGGACYTAAPNAFTTQFGPSRPPVDGPAASCTTTGSAPAYLIYYYEGDIDLPPGQWWLSVEPGTRLPDTQNIPNSTLQPVYLSAYLDNRGGIQNASPKFESLLQPLISPASLTPFSFSAFDADGDSLSYELQVPPKNCSQASTGTLTPHFGLHTGSGALAPLAASTSTQGIYNVTVKVTEYRRVGGRWALIGHVTRDSQYMLYPSTNQPPTFTTMQVNGGAAQALGAAIAVQPGQAVNVTLQATDPDVGQTLRFASDAPTAVPGLSLARVGTSNSLQLMWQVPATLPAGRYAIPVAVFDNGCPFNASTERTLVFVVGSTAVTATRAGALASAEVYPTPFREQVQFQTTPHQAVVLFDALGREVARLTSPADGLVRWQPAPTLPAGLYLARAADTGHPLARLMRAE